jgi:hypothetical protein
MSRRVPEPYLSAWQAVLTAHASVVARVEEALQDAGLPPLSWYDVLWAVCGRRTAPPATGRGRRPRPVCRADRRRGGHAAADVARLRTRPARDVCRDHQRRRGSRDRRRTAPSHGRGLGHEVTVGHRGRTRPRRAGERHRRRPHSPNPDPTIDRRAVETLRLAHSSASQFLQVQGTLRRPNGDTPVIVGEGRVQVVPGVVQEQRVWLAGGGHVVRPLH